MPSDLGRLIFICHFLFLVSGVRMVDISKISHTIHVVHIVLPWYVAVETSGSTDAGMWCAD